MPPLWVQLLDASWPAETTLTRLTNSGGALTPRLVRELRERFPAADLYAMYGLTEAFRSTFLDPALIAVHPDAIGRAIPFADVMAVRPDGARAAAGEPGELVHAGPLVAQGYSFEAADASFELLLREELAGERRRHFTVESWRVIVEQREDGVVTSEATVRLEAKGERVVAVGEGNGPVNALDEVFADPQVVARGMVQALPMTDGATVPSLRAPIVVDGLSQGAVHAAPALGEHAAEVLDPSFWPERT